MVVHLAEHFTEEIVVNGERYINAKVVEGGMKTIVDMAELGKMIEKAITVGVSKAMTQQAVIGTASSVQTIPSGFDKLPDEKKGSELVSMVLGKLPKRLRHGTRMSSFYTEFEQVTGIGLYLAHKKRIENSPDTADKSQYPYRKSDTLFTLADEKVIYDFATEFKFNIK